MLSAGACHLAGHLDCEAARPLAAEIRDEDRRRTTEESIARSCPPGFDPDEPGHRSALARLARITCSPNYVAEPD